MLVRERAERVGKLDPDAVDHGAEPVRDGVGRVPIADQRDRHVGIEIGVERDLRDVADGEGTGQPVAHDRVQRGLDQVRFPRWTGDLDATDQHASALGDDLLDVDGVAQVAGNERPVEVDHHTAGVGERERLGDSRVVAGRGFGTAAHVAEGLEHPHGLGVVGAVHEDVEVGERPQ